jgi:TP901 family phage tail tape measure protein
MFIELANGADEFGMSHGVQAFDPNTGAFVGIPSIIGQFHELISTMSDADALNFLSDTFGKPASSPLLALFRGGTEAYDEHAAKMEKLGTAASFMGALMNTTAGALDRLEASLSNAGRAMGIIIGQALTPFINLLGQLLSSFSQADPIILGLAAAFVTLGGALAVVAGSAMLFGALGGLLPWDCLRLHSIFSTTTFQR